MATKADIDKWITSQGGPDAVSYGYEDVDVANPAYRNSEHPNYEGYNATPEKIKTRRETWTNKATGASYSAVRTPYANDEFQDIKETPGTKGTAAAKTPEEIANTQATTVNTQTVTAARIAEEAEKDANAAAGRGRLTDAQWTAELARRQQAAVQAGNQAEANRIAQERLNFDKEKDARPDIKVESIDLPNGLKGTRIIKTPKDGGAPTIENRDQDGKPMASMPTPRSAEPPGAPKPGYRLGQITQGLSDYSAWLNEQVRLWQTSNGKEGMSPDAATKAMEQRRAEATSAISEQTGIANAQGTMRGQDITQRGQDLSETQSRRQAGRDIYTTVMNQYIPLLKYGAPGMGQVFADAQQEALNNALAYNRAWGGDRESPQVGTPAFLQSIMQTPPPGQAMGAAPTFGYRATDGAPPVAPVTVPSAAGAELEAANQAAQAGFRAANPINRPTAEPPPAPAVNPISNTPITVPVRPMQTPEPSMVPGTPSSVGDTGAPPVGMPPSAPPDYGAPGMRVLPQSAPAEIPLSYPDSYPVEMRPAQVPPPPPPTPVGAPDPGQPSDPQWQLPPNETSMAPSFLQTARYGQAFDPRGMALRRIAAGANPDIVGAAFEEMYGVPLQMAG